MARNRNDDSYKEKFRPDADAKLDAQIDAALGDVSVDALYGFDKPRSGGTETGEKGRGKGKSFPSIRMMSSSISGARARGLCR